MMPSALLLAALTPKSIQTSSTGKNRFICLDNSISYNRRPEIKEANSIKNNYEEHEEHEENKSITAPLGAVEGSQGLSA